MFNLDLYNKDAINSLIDSLHSSVKEKRPNIIKADKIIDICRKVLSFNNCRCDSELLRLLMKKIDRYIQTLDTPLILDKGGNDPKTVALRVLYATKGFANNALCEQQLREIESASVEFIIARNNSNEITDVYQLQEHLKRKTPFPMVAFLEHEQKKKAEQNINI